MSTESHEDLPGPHEEQICTSCVALNEPSAGFCLKCGAPLSSFSMITPFERLFAEGFIYREAANRPRKLITVLGVWFIFGMMAMASVGLISIIIVFQSAVGDWVAIFIGVAFGAALLAVSIAMIWKTTWNYLTKHEIEHKTDA